MHYTKLEKSQNFQRIQIVCFLLLLYSSDFCLCFKKKKNKKKKCPNNKKEIYNDKYRHTRDRLFGLIIGLSDSNISVLIFKKKYIIIWEATFSLLQKAIFTSLLLKKANGVKWCYRTIFYLFCSLLFHSIFDYIVIVYLFVYTQHVNQYDQMLNNKMCSFFAHRLWNIEAHVYSLHLLYICTISCCTLF